MNVSYESCWRFNHSTINVLFHRLWSRSEFFDVLHKWLRTVSFTWTVNIERIGSNDSWSCHSFTGLHREQHIVVTSFWNVLRDEPNRSIRQSFTYEDNNSSSKDVANKLINAHVWIDFRRKMIPLEYSLTDMRHIIEVKMETNVTKSTLPFLSARISNDSWELIDWYIVSKAMNFQD
jgi:hypothetical protein